MSSKKKRRYEAYLKREEKRRKQRELQNKLFNAESLEEMAALMKKN